MEVRNAIITSATLGFGERGILECWIGLDYGGSGQGFGGYALYLPRSFKNHRLLSHAGHFLYRVMEVAGVTEWNKLVGRSVRVRADYAVVHAIGHIVKDDWFVPGDDFAAAAQAQSAVVPQDWRAALAPIWAVLRPEIQWLAYDDDGSWWEFQEKPERGPHSWLGMDGSRLDALVMPTPDCPWQETLTERPEESCP